MRQTGNTKKGEKLNTKLFKGRHEDQYLKIVQQGLY